MSDLGEELRRAGLRGKEAASRGARPFSTGVAVHLAGRRDPAVGTAATFRRAARRSGRSRWPSRTLVALESSGGVPLHQKGMVVRHAKERRDIAVYRVAAFLPGAADHFRKLVRSLDAVAQQDVARASAHARRDAARWTGKLAPESDGFLAAELAGDYKAALCLAGQLSLVARAPSHRQFSGCAI